MYLLPLLRLGAVVTQKCQQVPCLLGAERAQQLIAKVAPVVSR